MKDNIIIYLFTYYANNAAFSATCSLNSISPFTPPAFSNWIKLYTNQIEIPTALIKAIIAATNPKLTARLAALLVLEKAGDFFISDIAIKANIAATKNNTATANSVKAKI